MNNPGLNSVLKYLESEKDRYLRAGERGMFCDSKTCHDTAQCIKCAIWDLEESMRKLNFDIKEG